MMFSIATSSGCASVKSAMRESSNTLQMIADLSVQYDDEMELEKINYAENHILESCEIVLTSAYSRVVGNHVPLLTWVEALLSSKDCRETVRIIRQQLYNSGNLHDQIAVLK